MEKNFLRIFLCIWVLFTIVFSPGFSEQVVFQNGLNGYDGVSDTYLNGYHETRKTHNFGASEILKVLGVPWGGLKQPALIRFDNIVGSSPNQIPQDAVIISARLELYKTRIEGTPANYKISVNEMLTDWKAGSSNGRAEEGSSCYAYRYYQKKSPIKWGVEEGDDEEACPVGGGVDYITHPSVAELLIGEETNVWMSFDVTGIVNDWVSGKKENYGFLIRAGGYWVGAEFYSSDFRDTSLRPRLIVNYAPKEIASDNWKLHFVPATLNTDKTIKLIPGYTQPLNIMLQAKKEVTNSADSHKIVMQLDLPKDIEIAETYGYYEIVDSLVEHKGNRKLISYCCVIKNNNIIGQPGARLQSEWNGQFFAVRIPDNIPKEEMYIQSTIKYQDTFKTDRWPLEFIEYEKGIQLKDTRIALWDYGMNFTEQSTKEVGRFLGDMGINHVQRGNRGYLGYKENGISTGGYIHHSAFYNSGFPDVNVHGNVISSSFSDPQAVINTNGAILTKTIETMINVANEQDGMVTVDYEPTATTSFSELSINEFKKQYAVSDAEFEELRDLIVTYGLSSHNIQDERRETYLKWVEFRSWQSEHFARITNEKIKEIDPNIRLQITTNPTCGDDDLSSIARGGNAARMGNHIEAIMPQTYRGYGKAATKYAILEARQWRDYVSCELYPVLLVRYAGATPKNSPARVRQQILGVLAEGADGIYLYYPQLMDATYWSELARTTRDIQLVEDFYQKGVRCEELFELFNMPTSIEEISAYPSITLAVENPDWHFTAHEKDGVYCLTLFNLKDDDYLQFNISTKDSFNVVETINANLTKNEPNAKVFSVSSEEVAIILLTKGN